MVEVAERRRATLAMWAVLAFYAEVTVLTFATWPADPTVLLVLAMVTPFLLVPLALVRTRVAFRLLAGFYALSSVLGFLAGGFFAFPSATLLVVAAFAPPARARWWAPFPRSVAVATAVVLVPLAGAVALTPSAPRGLTICTREPSYYPNVTSEDGWSSSSSVTGGYYVTFDNRMTERRRDALADRLRHDPMVTRVTVGRGACAPHATPTVPAPRSP